MKLYRDIKSLPSDVRSGAAAIGNFDGVHLGHARIIQRLADRAQMVGGPAVLFTFDPHPVRLLRPEHAPPPLTWTDRKAQLVNKLGVDAVIAYPTDDALLSLSPQAFFEQIVQQLLDAKAIVEGPNFYFGHNRAGNVEVLESLCQAARIAFEVVQPVMIDEEYVSSSRVRQLISNGEVAAACRMLTEPYRIRGMVTHGSARGSKIGFPTANIDAIDTLLPGEGVYAGRAYHNGSSYSAAINIGPNPTFGEALRKVEAHLLDFGDSLYGCPLEVDFLERMRDIRPFASVEELKAQLNQDTQRAREITMA